MRERGHRVRQVVGSKSSTDADVIEFPHAEGRGVWFNTWESLCRRLNPSRGGLSLRAYRAAGWLAEPGRFSDWFRGVEDFRFPATWRLLELDTRPPDILHLHNLHGDYFDLRALPHLSTSVPTVLTLHDAWLLSGHCAHSLDCDRWQSGCGQCPDLTLYPAVRRDATRYNWTRKRDIFRKSRLYVATPSQWLMDKVQRSILAAGIVDAKVIPNGVDLTVFRPQDRAAARAALGLPQDAAVLLFAANGIRRNAYKDYQTLREGFARLARDAKDRELALLAVGEDAEPESVGDAVIRFVPFVSSAVEMSRYYSAADVYVHAALADTFPTTVLEALACGTPVVATAVGGIPEQVKNFLLPGAISGSAGYGCGATACGEANATGVLVAPRDAEGLSAALTALLQRGGDRESLRRRLGENAAADARRRFDSGEQCEQYLRWYREILSTAALAAASSDTV
jgi:glycosyltransferase involved in cell wall biosynthesis